MLEFNMFLLLFLVFVAVFISNWLTPFILVIINRLLFIELEPFFILSICVIAATLGDACLWFFDEKIHNWLDNKIKIKKKTLISQKNLFNKLMHSFWDKVKTIKNKNKIMLGVGFASFSIIPDIFIVEFARLNLKFHQFIVPMFFGKFIIYIPLVRGSIGIINVLKNNL